MTSGVAYNLISASRINRIFLIARDLHVTQQPTTVNVKYQKKENAFLIFVALARSQIRWLNADDPDIERDV